MVERLVHHLAANTSKLVGTLSMTLLPSPGSDGYGTTAAHLEELIHSFPDRSNPDRSNLDQSTLAHSGNADLAERPASVGNITTNHLVRTASVGVDVERAEQEFAQLNRQFSACSEWNRRLSKQHSRQHSTAQVSDVEKAVSSDQSSEEPWDLETTLRGASAADREAGIKVKRIGAFHAMLTAFSICSCY